MTGRPLTPETVATGPRSFPAVIRCPEAVRVGPRTERTARTAANGPLPLRSPLCPLLASVTIGGRVLGGARDHQFPCSAASEESLSGAWPPGPLVARSSA